MRILVILAALLVSGCATQGGLALRDAIKGRAGAAVQESIDNQVYLLCGMPYSAMVSRFHGDERERKAITTVCGFEDHNDGVAQLESLLRGVEALKKAAE